MRVKSCGFARALAVCCGALSVGTRGVRAQAPVPTAARQNQNAREVQNLADALNLVNWDPASSEDGKRVLMAIDAAATQRFLPKVAPGQPRPLPPLPEMPRTGYRLRTIAPYFDRKIVSVGSVTVLAPNTMTVLNSRLGTADVFANLRPDVKMRMLQASLTKAQWAKLGSESGLGAGDLQPDQRALFLSSLPDPLVVRRVTVIKGGGLSYGDQSTVRPLSPEQRATVRMRLSRSTQVLIPMLNQPNTYGVVGDEAGRPEGSTLLRIEERYEDEERGAAYGAVIRQVVPSRLKPGQIDFNAGALDGVIAVDSIKTVRDLVARVAESARAELIVDARIADVPLTFKGGTRARAGDLLQGVCWALSSAFRRVGPAFVLTDDVDGLGARRQRIAEWAQAAQSRASAEEESLRQKIVKQQPMQFLGYDPNDLASQTPALREKMEAMLSKGNYGMGEEFKVGDLPGSLQTAVHAMGERHETPDGQNQYDISRVRVNPTISFTFMVPGVGTIQAENYRFMPRGIYDFVGNPGPPAGAPNLPTPAPFALPSAISVRSVLMRPRTIADVEGVLAEAKARGMTDLWLEVDSGGSAETASLLKAAITAGKAVGVRIVAVVSTLTVAPSEDSDRNILGETAMEALARFKASGGGVGNRYMGSNYGDPASVRGQDWLRQDQRKVVDSLRARLVALASTPGLGGLALRATAAPGYIDDGRPVVSMEYGMPQSEPGFGYTLENRLAFLRQERIDPIDLVMNNNGVANVDLNLPRYGYSDMSPNANWVDGRPISDGVQTRGQRWMAFRYEQNRRILSDLFTALRESVPSLPLFIRDRSESSPNPYSGYFGSWDAADRLPRQDTRYDPNQPSPIQKARAQSRQVLVAIPYLDPSTFPGTPPKMTAAQMLSLNLKFMVEGQPNQRGNWDGVVLDLSEAPPSSVVSLLGAVAQH